jgi:hypothetical protein
LTLLILCLIALIEPVTSISNHMSMDCTYEAQQALANSGDVEFDADITGPGVGHLSLKQLFLQRRSIS